MAMAAELHGSNASAQSSASRIVRVGVMRDMAAAEKIWRTFEGTDFLSTPYQRFELLDVWQKTIGKDEGAAPFVVAAYDVDNQPLALLPLAISRENGANVARFMGGKHPTFNMGLWRRDFAETFSAADMDALIAGIRTLPDRVDVLALTQQPKQWRGIPNPLVLPGAQPSTNSCPMMTMVPGCKPEERISASTRRRLRNKERKLQALPGYRYFVASADEDINRLLDSFFVIKPNAWRYRSCRTCFRTPRPRLSSATHVWRNFRTASVPSSFMRWNATMN